MSEQEARDARSSSRHLDRVRIDLGTDAADVAARADILSVHLGAGPDTKGLVNADVLGRLKPGAIVRQHRARRGRGLSDALAAAVRDTGLRVGLDVFANEPAAAQRISRIRSGGAPRRLRHAPHRRVHRPGAGGHRGRNRPHRPQLQGDRQGAERGQPRARTPATHMLVVRHRDRPGVLAHVFDHLREANLNVQETENIVFDGREAAVARINLDGAPCGIVVRPIKSGNADILDLQVVAL